MYIHTHRHRIAVAKDGKTYQWGDTKGDYARLLPVQTPYDSMADGLPSPIVDKITSSGFWKCALSGGKVFCRGRNLDGILGSDAPIPPLGPPYPEYPYRPVGAP